MESTKKKRRGDQLEIKFGIFAKIKQQKFSN